MILKKFLRTKAKGQSVLEYTILILIVVTALSTMSLYVRRAIYANIKLLQDQVNFEAKK